MRFNVDDIEDVNFRNVPTDGMPSCRILMIGHGQDDVLMSSPRRELLQLTLASGKGRLAGTSEKGDFETGRLSIVRIQNKGNCSR